MTELSINLNMQHFSIDPKIEIFLHCDLAKLNLPLKVAHAQALASVDNLSFVFTLDKAR